MAIMVLSFLREIEKQRGYCRILRSPPHFLGVFGQIA
jgi:hypothetical protein